MTHTAKGRKSPLAITIKCVSYLLLLGSLAIRSCKVNTDRVCTEYHHPVCGDDGITYENECLAQCAGVDYYDGTCAMDAIGSIQFSGDSLCGYLVNILNLKFKPDTLGPEFKVENLLVFVKYRQLNQYYICDNPYGNYQVIQVIEMQTTAMH